MGVTFQGLWAGFTRALLIAHIETLVQATIGYVRKGRIPQTRPSGGSRHLHTKMEGRGMGAEVVNTMKYDTEYQTYAQSGITDV